MEDPAPPADVYRADEITFVAEGYRPRATRIDVADLGDRPALTDAYFHGYPQLVHGDWPDRGGLVGGTTERRDDDGAVGFDREEVDPDAALLAERDVRVEAQDGTDLAVNVYRPETDEPVPAILAWGMWGKDAQETVFWLRATPQPYQERPFWDGGLEAGDTPYLVDHGYAHVVPDPRGVGNSGGGPIRTLFDLHDAADIRDVVEWTAAQPWCDGSVGMIGPSSYAFAQAIVGQDPPDALVGCFPTAFWYTGEWTFTGMRDASLYNIFHGGHMYDSTLPLSMDSYTTPMTVSERPEDELESLLAEIRADPDIRYNSKLYTVFEYPMKDPMAFDLFVNEWFEPHAPPGDVGDISVPTYVGAVLPGGAHHRIYWEAFEAWAKLADADERHKLLILPPGELARPFVDYHDETVRWTDAVRGDGSAPIFEEPRVKTFVMGVDRWAFEDAWPPERVQWTDRHLQPEGRLGEEPGNGETVGWRQSVPLEDSDVHCLRFTDRIEEDTELMGPISLHLRAAIDDEDTNWIVDLVDVGPDGHQQLLSQGWLRASYRGLDEEASMPGWPIHTTEKLPIAAGEVHDYQVAMAPTSAVVRAGHELELVLRNQDDMDGQLADRGVYFLPLMRDVTHTLHLDGGTFLRLPVTGRGEAVRRRLENGDEFA